MASDRDIVRPVTERYRYCTVRPLYGLVFITPMLIAFQVGTAYYYGTGLLATHHLRRVLEYFGASAAFLPAVLVATTLFVQHLTRKDPWKLRGEVFAGMLGESVLWMCPLGVMMGLAGRLQAGEAGNGFLNGVLQAFGAGIYEEFLFRLLLIGLVLVVFVDVFRLKKDAVLIGAIVLAGLAFSMYHLSGEEISQFPHLPWPEVIFRAAAGIYLGALFILRGFGITVGAHAFYNIYAIIASQPLNA